MIAAGLLSLTGALAQTPDDLPYYSALHTREAPRVDGVLDETCWRGAQQTRPFVTIGGAGVDVATRAMACWDRTTLYVAYVCPEPEMAHLEARLARGELGRMDESIELFLDAACDRFTYLQLRVDLLGNRDTHGRNDLADELTGRWRGAVARNAAGWTVEIAVPFALLKAQPPDAGRLWTWNANRQRLAHGGPVEWTCWSDTKGGFHSPARFGQLVFTDFRAWLRFHTKEQIDAVEEQMADLAARYPQVTGEFVARLGTLERERVQMMSDLTARPLSGDDERRAAAARSRALVAAYEAALQEMREVVLRDVLR